MPAGNTPRVRALRVLLMADGTVLLLLGALLMLFPKRVEAAFHFANLPDGVSYLIGMWGCALVSLGVGYAVAAGDPARHVVWVKIGIVRALLETIFGGWAVRSGVVTWQQAGFGIIMAIFIAVAYIVLYPKNEDERWNLSAL
jgi:hypothetical protein